MQKINLKRFFVSNLVPAVLCLLLTVPSLVYSGGAVATKAGNKYRVIVKRPCSLYAKADISSESSPCGVFQYWYVLPPKESNVFSTDNSNDLESNGFFRVASGDSEGEFRGYIRTEDAKLWTHQQVVKLSKRQGRELGHFYMTPEDAVNALKTKDVSKATHREPESTSQDLILMPVMKAKEVNVNNEKMMCFKTAFMAAPISTLKQNPANQTVSKSDLPELSGKPLTKERVRKEASVDIAFVVDTTSSMKPIIEQVKNSVSKAAKDLAQNPKLQQRIRYGLVAYRDTVGNPNALEYTAKVVCTLEEGKDHGYFVNTLNSLEDANKSSLDYAEDVLAGLKSAMNVEKLKWNPMAWKHIVIVGDSSLKGPDHPDPRSNKNRDNISIAQVKTMAQPGSDKIEEKLNSNFVINVVYVQDPNWKNDQQIGEKQYNNLISGRSYGGELILAKGGSSPEDFSGKLTESLTDRFKNFNDTVLTQSGSTSTSSRTPSSSHSAARYPYPVLELMNSLEGGTSSGHSFANSFSTEYDAEGNRLLIPHLWVRKGDLKSFNSLLEFLVGQLEDAGEPGSKDIQKVLNGMKMISTTLNLNEPITSEMPLERFFKLLGGFPLKSPIFTVSILDIAAMSQTDYNDWVKNIRICMETLRKLAENQSIWFKLHPLAKDREEHAFIAMTDLP